MLLATAAAAMAHGFEVLVFSRAPVSRENKYARRLAGLGIRVFSPCAAICKAVERLLSALGFLGQVAFPVYMLWRRVPPGQAWRKLRGEVRFHFVRPVQRAFLDGLLVRNLNCEHRRHPFALVHSHRSDEAMIVVAKWARRRGLPMLCHYHAGVPLPLGFRRRPWVHTEEEIRTIAQYATLVVLTEGIAQSAREAFGSQMRVAVVPNWVPRPEQGIGDEPNARGALQVGTVCRLVENKGLEVLIAAVDRLKKSGVPVRCHIAGTGPLLSALRRAAEVVDVKEEIVFHGELDTQAVQHLLQALHLFVLPSEDEGLPITVLEAMAAGLPVIATPVGGVPEMVHDGVNGLLVPVGDAQALAEAITALATDPDLRRRMGEASWRIYEQNYTEDVVWPRLEALYLSLIEGSGGDTQ